MKKLLLACILLLSSIISIAHVLTPLCWDNGRFNFSATQGISGNARITIVDINNQSTGQFDTIINVDNTGNFNFSVPQILRTQIVRVKVKWSDEFINYQYSTIQSCNPLALRALSFNAINEGDSILLELLVEDEVNVGYYRIKISTDNIKWQTILIFMPEALKRGRYTFKIKSI